MTSKDLKTAMCVMRIMPALFVITMCLHTLLLLIGHGTVWTEVFLGLLVAIELYAASIKLGYCRLHRAGILYGYTVFFCCGFQRAIGFGILRSPLHIILTITGLILTAQYAHHFIVGLLRHNKIKQS